MTALHRHLDRLLAFLEAQGSAPPTRGIRIVEIERKVGTDARGRVQISRDSLLAPADFASRFDELLAAHPAWINLSCYGIENGSLIVGVEVSGPAEMTTPRTSVNYAGPPAAVLKGAWQASEALAIR